MAPSVIPAGGSGEAAGPDSEAAFPRLLTPREDGIPIPESIAEYVLLVARGANVTIYVEEGAHRQKHPALDGILKSLERRKTVFRTVDIVALPMEQLDQVRRRHQTGLATTVAGERRVLQLLRTCAEMGATDIRLKQYRKAAGVELRIDGEMVGSVQMLSKSDLRDYCTALWNVSDTNSRRGNYTELVSASTSIVHKLKELGLDDVFAAIRCQFNATGIGPECDVRLQPAGQTARPFEQLGLTPATIATIRRATAAPGGALFISGPMGSGKTNLLASTVLDFHQRKPEKKIGTIEDPVEIFIADRISQWVVTGLGDDREKEFKDLLIRSLRSDLQMLMLQECRDGAAAAAFLEMAVTGALGISTIHTPNAMKIIRRLHGWGIDEVVLTDPEIMRLLGAVRLVPVLCSCKVPIEKALKEGHARAGELAESIARLQRHADRAYRLRGHDAPRLIGGCTRRPAGCDVCQARSSVRKLSYGITGRTQLAEMIIPDAILLEHLYKGRLDSAHHHARAVLRCPSVEEDALDRIAAGTLCPLDAENSLGLFGESGRDARFRQIAGVAE
jgi:type II secretory ATPase GspE/PulE/Tfp pilus assembly ATPase PilB-like protein